MKLSDIFITRKNINTKVNTELANMFDDLNYPPILQYYRRCFNINEIVEKNVVNFLRRLFQDEENWIFFDYTPEELAKIKKYSFENLASVIVEKYNSTIPNQINDEYTIVDLEESDETTYVDDDGEMFTILTMRIQHGTQDFVEFTVEGEHGSMESYFGRINPDNTFGTNLDGVMETENEELLDKFRDIIDENVNKSENNFVDKIIENFSDYASDEKSVKDFIVQILAYYTTQDTEIVAEDVIDVIPEFQEIYNFVNSHKGLLKFSEIYVENQELDSKELNDLIDEIKDEIYDSLSSLSLNKILEINS